MKKLYTIVVIVFLSCICNVAYAQDQIETNGGHTYEVKILEETDDFVEFYFLHDEDKEPRKMSIKNISKIVRNAWEASAKEEQKKQEVSSKEEGKTNNVDNKEDKSVEVASTTKKEIKPETKEKATTVDPVKEKATNKTAQTVAKKPIKIKEENDIKCLYSKDDASGKVTKTLIYNSVNINSAPLTLLKKFSLHSVRGVREGDKMYLVFKVLGASGFSMNAKNKMLIKLSNGSVVDLYNIKRATSVYKSKYEANIKIEVPEFHLSDLIEHKSLRFRLILDKGYIEFTNNARTSHWVSRALLCVS